MADEVNPDVFFNKANFAAFAMLAQHPQGLTLQALEKKLEKVVAACEVHCAVWVLVRERAVSSRYLEVSPSVNPTLKYRPREGGVDAFTRFACFVEEQCWVKAKPKLPRVFTATTIKGKKSVNEFLRVTKEQEEKAKEKEARN